MSELQGQPGEIHLTLEIVRAATGEKETVELVGTVTADDEEDAE
jgi:hypothetical protein